MTNFEIIKSMDIDTLADLLSEQCFVPSNDDIGLMCADRQSVYDWLKSNVEDVDADDLHCNQCKYYEGVHGVPGHAPCSLLKRSFVMSNDSCIYGIKVEELK